MVNRCETLIDMTDWDVYRVGNNWEARINDHGTVIVGRVDKLTQEQAIDATLDYMDRCRTGRVPRGVTEPRRLMDICVAASRRQR